MNTQPKFLHVARGSMAGQFSAVALCGRLVGRLSLLNTLEADRVTCPKCKAKAEAAGLLTEPAPVVLTPEEEAEDQRDEERDRAAALLEATVERDRARADWEVARTARARNDAALRLEFYGGKVAALGFYFRGPVRA